jgi:hypothetical protein
MSTHFVGKFYKSKPCPLPAERLGNGTFTRSDLPSFTNVELETMPISASAWIRSMGDPLGGFLKGESMGYTEATGLPKRSAFD